MKLYIKQKVFTIGDNFTVWDASGKARYFAQSEFFTLGRRINVCDTNVKRVISIKQKLLSFLPRFEVFVGDNKVAEVVKEFAIFKARYRIEGPGWEVTGDWWDHRYEITKDGELIVSVQKEWMSWGDSYRLDIYNPRDELMALAVVLAIDCAVANAQAAASAAT